MLRFDEYWLKSSDPMTRIVIPPHGAQASPSRRQALVLGTAALSALSACGGGGGGSGSSSPSPPPPPSPPAQNDALLLDIHQRTFNYFWNLTDPVRGLTPDRSATGSVVSIAACGFGLVANVIGASRGYVSRADAATRTSNALSYFWNAPQGSSPSSVTGYNGFFYHFLDMTTGLRAPNSELSSIDTAIFIMGVLTAGAYFTGSDAVETRIRTLSAQIAARVDWTFLLRPSGLIGMGWTPENGFIPTDWVGYNEGMMIYLLAMASTSFPVPASAYTGWTSGYDATFGAYMGQTYLGFAPLFGHQLNHCWIDFRNIADAYMRSKSLDYFENSRRATLAQQQYAAQNPGNFTGYGSTLFGLTACDGPANVSVTLGGTNRAFKTYYARGAGISGGFDDGTLAPTAAVSSINFTPVESYQVVQTLQSRYGADVIGTYGYVDAFNPTFVAPATPTTGRISASAGWVDSDYLGIDQGPILMMIENYSTGLIWNLTKSIAPIKQGLLAAGFQATSSSGGWINS